MSIIVNPGLVMVFLPEPNWLRLLMFKTTSILLAIVLVSIGVAILFMSIRARNVKLI